MENFSLLLKALRKLVEDYPNDQQLGKAVRELITKIGR